MQTIHIIFINFTYIPNRNRINKQIFSVRPSELNQLRSDFETELPDFIKLIGRRNVNALQSKLYNNIHRCLSNNIHCNPYVSIIKSNFRTDRIDTTTNKFRIVRFIV